MSSSPHPPDEAEGKAGEAVCEEIFGEIVDLEDYAALGMHVPRARSYRIRVNRDK